MHPFYNGNNAVKLDDFLAHIKNSDRWSAST